MSPQSLAVRAEMGADGGRGWKEKRGEGRQGTQSSHKTRGVDEREGMALQVGVPQGRGTGLPADPGSPALSVGATGAEEREPWLRSQESLSPAVVSSGVSGQMYHHSDLQSPHLENEQNIVPSSWVVVRNR